MRARPLVWTSALLVGLSAPALGTSFVMMADQDLADQADVIAEVRVREARPAPGPAVATEYVVELARLVKGEDLASSFSIRVPGGPGAGGSRLDVWGAPRFEVGEQALLFLERRADASFGVLQLMLGAFHQAEAGGRRVAFRRLRGARPVARPGEPPREDPGRDLEAFVAWLADRAAGVERDPDYALDSTVEVSEPTTAPFTLLGNARWFAFDSGGSVTWRAHQSGQSGMSGGGFTQFQTGLQAWNDEPQTPINLLYGGTTTASGGFVGPDGINAILFDDPNGEISGSFSCTSGGVLAVGGYWTTGGTGSFKGMTFNVIGEADVITQDGAGCFLAGHGGEDGEEVFGHELGHTLGLGHSCGDAASGACDTTAKDEALMRAIAHGDGRGARLGSDDQAGAQFLYAPAPAEEAVVAFTASSSSVAEASGTVVATVRMTTSSGGPAGQDVVVPYSTLNGTALAGQDYASASGTVAFAAGSASGATRTISVTILDDVIDEAPETFTVRLSSPTGAALGSPRDHVVTIADDDPPPSLTLSHAAAVIEGHSGTTDAVFTVSLSSPSGQSLSVRYATADGNALAGSDYQATAGTLTIPAGTSAAAIRVPVIGDLVDEPNEGFLLELSSPVNATIAVGRAQATILDDDGRPALCRPILLLPFSITAQGSYCLVRNLSTNVVSGAAITIEADFVVLDLKGFKIGGGSAGPATVAVGVYALNRQNVTVMNGNVRGFLRGVFLEDTSSDFSASRGHLLRGLRADENTLAGLHVQGRNVLVRGNHVVASSGTTALGTDADTYGILIEGPLARVLDNEVMDTVGVGAGWGIAIGLSEASGAVVERNRVANRAAVGSVGVRAISGQDVMVVGNRIATMEIGVVYEAASGKYRGNLTSGVATPYSGGSDAGDNQ